jgi:hypothetical protein
LNGSRFSCLRDPSSSSIGSSRASTWAGIRLQRDRKRQFADLMFPGYPKPPFSHTAQNGRAGPAGHLHADDRVFPKAAPPVGASGCVGAIEAHAK